MSICPYERTVIILRGCPGSGKSTLATTLAQEITSGFKLVAVICSADDYFKVNSGTYKFIAAKLGEAHAHCRGKAEGAMAAGASSIIVDNTNTTQKEWAPYVDLALKYGYKVTFMEPDTPWKFDAEELVKRTTHGVPRETIERMLARWEPTLAV